MISLDKHCDTPAYMQIYQALRDEITRGIYRTDERLPSVRILAEQLGVSRNTVNKAYQQLFAEGFVISRDRSGYYIDPDILKYADFPTAAQVQATRGEAGFGPDIMPCERPVGPNRVPYDFFYGALPDGLLPQELLRHAIDEALYAVNGSNDYYFDTFGLQEFRAHLARHLGRTRSVRCSAEQVVVQSGTREGYERLLRLFDPERDTIGVEQPGYRGMVEMARNNRFNLGTLDSTSRDRFFADLESSHAKLVFVTPSHQFPTGRVMAYADRIRLIEWAERNDAYIVEDDYDSEYRFDGEPIPSLQSLDPYGRVIYSGTFSKTFSPGLRTSYLVLPPQLVSRYRNRLASYWCSVPWIVQKTLGVLLESGDYERQVRRQVKYFRTSQRLLVEALQARLSDVVSIAGEGAGLHLWLLAKDGRCAKDLADAALQKGVRIYPADCYWAVDPAKANPNALVMGYSNMPHQDIDPGVERLRQAWVPETEHGNL